MKKLLFSLLGVFLFFQRTNAQESGLNEYLQDSENTLQAEISNGEEINTDNENIEQYDDNTYYDEDDYFYEDDYPYEDNYYDKERQYHADKDWDFDLNENDIGKIIGFWIGFIWIFFICRLIGFIFWIWMLIDAAKYQKSDRVGWILVLVFFNILWALIYLFAAKIWRKKEDRLDC